MTTSTDTPGMKANKHAWLIITSDTLDRKLPESQEFLAWLRENGEDVDRVVGVVVYDDDDVLIDTAMVDADGEFYENRLHGTVAATTRRFSPPVPMPEDLQQRIAGVIQDGVPRVYVDEYGE